ncbi:MAG: hypothetical protein C0483_07040 [Pirellula sp.]|nr:hypothetical protein [Pirellula sp.]
MKLPAISRRRFLQGTALGAAAVAAGTGYALKQDRLRLGLIGCGARGRQLAGVIGYTRARPLYGEITAVCDADSARADELRAGYCRSATIYRDFRKLLERDDLDAVIIATPDHWHTAMMLEALRCGKSVYCEKPLSLTVAEGRMLTQAAAKSPHVVQVGTQQRSDWRFQAACDLVRNERLGRIRRVNVSLPIGSLPITSFGGPFPAEAPPATLDWDLWLGQAPEAPFTKQRFDPFRWWFEYSGGFMTDWGAHHLDIVHWALGPKCIGTTRIEPHAELPRIANGYNTPRQFSVELTYPDNVRVHVETSATVNGIRFEGENGSLFVSRHKIDGPAYDALNTSPLSPNAIRLRNCIRPWGTANYVHMTEFLHCVRSGERPISDVASQHQAAAICHVTNIAMRLGRPLIWDAAAEHFTNDPEADTMLARPQRSGYEIRA